MAVLSVFDMRTRLAARALLPVLAVALAACSSQPSGGGSGSPNPQTVLKQAGQALTTVQTLGADVKFTGAKIQVQGLTLRSAASRVHLPADSDTTFKAQQGDFLLDLQVVTSGGRTFIKLPFSGFTELTGTQAQDIPNISQLLSAESGLPAVLKSAKKATYEGTEKVAGVECDKVAATFSSAQVANLLGGRLTPQSDIQTTVWSGRSDHLVRKALLSGKFISSGQSQIEVDLHNFNQPVTITPPPTD